MAAKTLAFALIVSLGFGTANVRATDYKNEYDKKVKATQDIGALGSDLAGDSINYYTGATSFATTDLSVPGNNSLPVAIGRRYNVELEHFGGWFGDWDLEIPYLSAVMTAAGGWVVSGASPKNRCSTDASYGAPPTVMQKIEGGFRTYAFEAHYYWHGYTMHLPSGDQTMLVPVAANTFRPTAGGPYYWTTNQDWWFSCIPLAYVQAGYPGGTPAGEGFLALSPDGTRYWFDRMMMRGATDVEAAENFDGAQTWHFTLPRAEYRLYPSRVEDRFGNWVQYNWNDTQLQSITSSDGRSIQLTWTGNFISQVSDGVRNVQYAYNDTAVDGNPATLDKVTRGDGSYWEYGLGALYWIPRPEPECMTPNQPLETWDCYGGGAFTPADAAAYVRHPSGARIEFRFGQRFRYSATSGFKGFYPFMMLEKTIRGAGLTDATWKFGLAPDVPETRTACRAGACPSRVWSDEVAPDGSIKRRVFGAQYNVDESLLLSEFEGAISKALPSGGNSAITSSQRWGSAIFADASPVTGTSPVFYRERDNRYVGPTTFPVGDSLLMAGEKFTSTRKLPTNASYLYERGVTLATLTQGFSPAAHPTQVHRSSSNLAGPQAGYSRTDTMTYLTDTARWVLGLPLTKISAGVEVSRTEYHPSLLLPIRTYRYGLPQGAIAYNTDGTTASVTDPRGNVTTLAGWQFGTPTSIQFPASGGVSAPKLQAGMSNPGRIDWVVNEVGSKTCYDYDAMQRMKKITYTTESSTLAVPLCGTQDWAASDRSFTWQTATEYGLVGNHWRQTVSTGTGQTTTLFNALWQPVLSLTEDTANASTRSFVVNRYDAMGRKVFTSYPVASATVDGNLTGTYYDYDVLGRPWRTRQDSELGSLTSTTLYLPGFQTRTTNPRGFSTTSSFQIFDDPGANAPVKIEAPEGVTTVITRDLYGNPLQVTRSGPAG